MTKIKAERLSSRYSVKKTDLSDIDELYELYSSHTYYFEYFSLKKCREELYKDMTMLPDGCDAEQKHFLAYCDKEPVAILDLIEGYPTEKVCYIGLFMVRAQLSGQGTGSAIISELCEALHELGFEALRLAYGKKNTQAVNFWTKNGFVPVKEAYLPEYGELIVAQREL